MFSSFLRARVPWLLLVGVLLHAVLGAALGLSVDEAHYLLYAAHPALSYFDHPPLVGWVQWPLVALGAPVAVLRLLPGALWWGTVWAVYRLSLRVWAGHALAQPAAVGAVWVLLLAPLMHVLGIGLLPDTLLMAITVALLWQTCTLLEPQALARPAPWLVMGLLLGLAGLSKYTAVFTALALGVSVLRVHGLRLLRLPAFWGALVLALLMVTPVLVWNAQHQWASFVYQLAHGKGSEWQLLHVLRFLLVQLVVFGPLLLAAAWARGAGRGGYLWLAFAVPFGIFSYMAGGGTSLPHWTAPAWVALAPLAGLGLARLWQGRARWLLGVLAGVQALVCAGLLGLMLSAGWPVVPGSTATVAPQPNPFADLHGWELAGARAQALADQQHLGGVAVQNWTLASRLGWYARPLPVYVLEDRETQFRFWAGDLPVGGDTLLVDWSYLAYELPLGAHGFASCTLLETLPVRHWGMPLASFRFYDCRGWAGAPLSPRTLPPSP